MSSIKLLGFIFNEKLSKKGHIKFIENDVSENIGMLSKAKHVLNHLTLKSVYFSFVHSEQNYGNIAWESTIQGKLKMLSNQQKLVFKIISGNNGVTLLERMEPCVTMP